MDSALGRLRAVIREVLDAGETQKALAGRLGVTQPTISDWFKEDRLDPKASALGAVARALGINGHWLLTGQGDKRELGSGGADAVFAAGVQEGLARAEKALRALRATSGGAARGVVAKAEQKAAGAKAAVEAHTPPPPRARRRKREG